MPAVQIRDILKSLRTFYGQLSERFAREQQRVGGQQLPYLLDYIATHEKQLEAGVERIEESAGVGLPNTLLQLGALEMILSQIDRVELSRDRISAAFAILFIVAMIAAMVWAAMTGDASTTEVIWD